MWVLNTLYITSNIEFDQVSSCKKECNDKLGQKDQMPEFQDNGENNAVRELSSDLYQREEIATDLAYRNALPTW